MHSDISFFDKKPTGSLANVLSSDVEAIRLSVTEQFPKILMYACTLIVSALYMLITSPRLTAIGVSVAPVIGLIASVLGKVVGRVARKMQLQLGVALGVATENLASVRCVKAFGHEALVSDKYEAEVEEAFLLARYEVFIHKIWNALNMLAGGCATILVLREAGRDVLDGKLTGGQLLAFAVYGVTAGQSVNEALNAFQHAKASAAKATTALRMLDDESARVASAAEEEEALLLATAQKPPEGKAAANVSVRDVFFAYEARESLDTGGRSHALEGLSFELAADRVTALVGPSGCGKSTMLQLLLRFYHPTSGVIIVGGADLSTLPNEWVRNNIGIVAQEPTIFRATIRENIAFGARQSSVRAASRSCSASRTTNDMPIEVVTEDGLEMGGQSATAGGAEATDELDLKIQQAAVAANAHDFIMEAGGYDVAVGEHGTTLSGGQRQRIAIARSLLRDPALLLLDEATASLDANSERIVQEALEGLSAGRAMFIVAHRLATIKAADEIIVLERGRLLERGTHEVLAASNGLYSKLSMLQRLDIGSSNEISSPALISSHVASVTRERAASRP
uniref:ATP-dependent transporter ycf16 n=1 Tax=Prymnesium polylepis TaxID=72548 RepID=A0A6T7YDP1_9EUKA